MGFLSFASAINFRTFVDSLERSQLPWKAKFEVVLSGSILSFPFLLFPRESEESVNESKVENETETTFETPEGSSKEDKGTEMADTDKESGIDTEREKRISGQFLSGPRDPDLSVPVAAEVCQPCNSGESAPQNGEDTMLPVPKISQSSADDKASTSTSEAADTALSEEPTVRAEGGDIEMEESERNNDVTLQPHSLSPATANIISQTKIASGSPDITFQDLKRQARKFNIDLAPKLLFARGPLVEILISANISHYADFRTADRILTYRNGEIIQVPCSRADVFSSTFVSVIEKRLLMKFLTFCGNFEEHLEEYSGFEGKPFIEFLKSKRLTTNLQHFVIHAIAMVKENTDTVTGIRETQRFLRSLGRYSNSPFIWTIYGTGELPQAFCRMSAVFGGVYCLRNATKSIILSKETDKVQAIICSDSQRISAKYLIMGKNYLPSKYSVNANEHVSRAVLITNRSVKESEEDSVTLLTVPPMEGYEEPVRVIEIGPASMACPRGLFVVYLTTRGVGTAQNDLQPYVQQLFNTESNNESVKPKVLWSFYYNQEEYTDLSRDRLPDSPENMFVINPPGMELGFELPISEARRIFDTICPDEDFLPPVPNPDDIIWDQPQAAVQPGGGFLEQEGQQEQLLQENQAAPMTVEADIRLDGGVNQEIVQAQETLETDTVDSNQSEQNQENERLVEETLDQKETKPAEKS